MDLFTAPWPGPGNSEGPVDPDRWTYPVGAEVSVDATDTPLLVDLPWPGPGDSEG